MTVQTRNQLRVLVWTVLAGLILLTAPKAAEQLVFRPEYDAHVRKSEVVDSLLLEASKEILCEIKPLSRKCR